MPSHLNLNGASRAARGRVHLEIARQSRDDWTSCGVRPAGCSLHTSPAVTKAVAAAAAAAVAVPHGAPLSPSRRPPRLMTSAALLRRLASNIGREEAAQELKWLRQHASGGHDSLQNLLAKRVAGQPLQYILGSQPFGDLDIIVRPPVLIPRPETEHWTFRLADVLAHKVRSRSPISVLDLGTGTGCIPLLLCHLLPQGTVRAHGFDISPDAVALATENAAACKTPAVTNDRRVNTFSASLADFASARFRAEIAHLLPCDVLTSNPPYISTSEPLPPEVRDWEDHRALFAGSSGLQCYDVIGNLLAAPGFLAPDGVVALEIGHTQAQPVRDILAAAGLRDIEIWQDPWGKDRTVVARSGA
ncbi:S-adenosyl-L-methionine-dependent methyltransferase [Schizophyllum amplum]|uniref:S-adenosyl-L-methionine-dependent methyltransferase n=1 Tax=Schizophyllum amplum TaxID=97359 RepID=A0A550CX73_9AGAR|nr:S-adenosyl-L-methionine-dependent methyltransferase [Auriculariopsis ampla]